MALLVNGKVIAFDVVNSRWRDWASVKSMMVRNADPNFISFCNSRGLYKREELF